MSWRKLCDRLTTIGHLEQALAMLEWDQFVMMPPGAARVRADASATLVQMAHGCVAAPERGNLVEAARAEDFVATAIAVHCR